MIIKEIKAGVINGDEEMVSDLIKRALVEGYNVKDILHNALISGMTEIGEMFQKNEIFLPEMLFAARTMQEGMKALGPILVSSKVNLGEKIILGTVKNDVHDIGKNLVGMMLKGAGFEVVDLGIDVSPEKFLDAIKTHNPVLVGMSSLLGTTMQYMKDTVHAIKAEKTYKPYKGNSWWGNYNTRIC
jgi:5-methyltetrahydrofolate--homocysteine methyltransferase